MTPCGEISSMPWSEMTATELPQPEMVSTPPATRAPMRYLAQLPQRDVAFWLMVLILSFEICIVLG